MNNNNANNSNRAVPDWASHEHTESLHSEICENVVRKESKSLAVSLNNSAWMPTTIIIFASYPHAAMNELKDVINPDILFGAMNKCLRGVIWKDSVAHFYINWATEIDRLIKEIENEKYKQRKPAYFRVGKRDIMSIAFRDRCIQRALNDYVLYPAISPTLIKGNCACQEDKGTLYAKDYFKQIIRREWRNHGTKLYVLKCDIEGYYKNIPHNIGEAELKRVLPDCIYTFLRDKILSIYEGENGYIAGNQTVQIIGISVLSPLDHYIKEKLRIKGYIRYMDDFILISHDLEYLEYCLAKIEEFLEAIGLRLNKKKTKIIDLEKECVEFLGFDFKLTETGKVCAFVASSKVKKKRIELYRMAQKVKRGDKERSSADKAYMDWRTHAMYGDTKNFLDRMDKYYFGLYGEEVPVYVKNQKKPKRKKRNRSNQVGKRNIALST